MGGKRRQAGASTSHDGTGSGAHAKFRRQARKLLGVAADRVQHGTLLTTHDAVVTADGGAVSDGFLGAGSTLSDDFAKLCKHYRGKMPDVAHDEVVVSVGEALVAMCQYQAATELCFRKVRYQPCPSVSAPRSPRRSPHDTRAAPVLARTPSLPPGGAAAGAVVSQGT